MSSPFRATRQVLAMSALLSMLSSACLRLGEHSFGEHSFGENSAAEARGTGGGQALGRSRGRRRGGFRERRREGAGGGETARKLF